jgi:hypothetical protein
MLALDLNLASRPFRNNTLLWLAHVGAVVGLALFTTWSVTTWLDFRENLRDLRQQVASIDVQFADLDSRETKAKRARQTANLHALEVQTSKANAIIQWKAFSWTELFNVLESVQPNDVRMTAVYPRFHDPRVQAAAAARSARAGAPAEIDRSVPVSVEGLARNERALLDLETALLAAPYFERVEPERTARVEGSGETAFELRFLYDPVAAVAVSAPPPGAGPEAGGSEAAPATEGAPPDPTDVTEVGRAGFDAVGTPEERR